MTGVTIVMSGDDARVQAMINRQIQNQEKFLAKLKETAAGSKKLSDDEIAALKKKADEEAAFQKLQAKATKIVAEMRSEQDKYAESVRELVAMRKASLLTDEQYRAKLDQLKSAYKAQIESVNQLKNTHKGAASSIKSDQEGIVKGTQKIGEIQKTMTGDVVKALANWAAGYASVQAAISATNQLLDDQKRLQGETASNVDAIGKAQAEAGQNFVGLNDQEKLRAETIGLRVQKATGFKEDGTLTKMAGEAFGSQPDLDVVEDAVAASARLNLLTRDRAKPMAVGAADLVQSTGIKNAEQNMSLLLSTQKLSRTASVEGTSKNLPVIIANAQASLPEQNQQDLTTEMGASFGAFSTRLVDESGDVTKTTLVELTRAMDKFFSKAPDKLSETSIKINELRSKIAQRAKDRKPADESDAAELKKLEAEQQTLGTVQDPKTFFGRVRALQGNQSAAKMLLESPFGPGEAAGLYRQFLTDSNSDISKQVFEGKGQIDLTERTYNETLRQQKLTPEQRLGIETAKNDAAVALRRSDPRVKAIDEISKVTKEALLDSRQGNVFGLSNPTMEWLNEQQIRSATTPEEAARIADEALAKRSADLEQFRFSTGPLTPSEGIKQQNLSEARARLRETVGALPGPSGAGINTVFIGPQKLSSKGLVTPDEVVRGTGQAAAQPAAPLTPAPQKIEVDNKLDATEFTRAVGQFTNAVNRLLNPLRPIASPNTIRAQMAQGVQ